MHLLMRKYSLLLGIIVLVFLMGSAIAESDFRRPSKLEEIQRLRRKFPKDLPQTPPAQRPAKREKISQETKNSLKRKTIASSIEDLPFGLLGVGEPTKRWQDYTDYLVELNVYWVRMAGRQGLSWGSVQSSKDSGYDWSIFDAQVKALQDLDVNIVFHFDPRAEWDRPVSKTSGRRVRAGASLPNNLQAYAKFVQATVERYDADGADDMPGLIKPILIWMTHHEPDHPQFWQDSPESYATLIKITYEALKKANAEAKLVIAGSAGSIEGYLYKNESPPSGFSKNNVLKAREQNKDGFFVRVFKALKEQQVKFKNEDLILDFHWFGDFGDYQRFKEFVNYIHRLCKDFSFTELPIWVTETSTFSGNISLAKGLGQAGANRSQTEKEQAIELFKRYIFSLASGIKRIFWSKIETYQGDDLFSNVGIADSSSRPKLAYYTYRLMTDKLKDTNLHNIEMLLEDKDFVYAYKIKSDKPLYIVWWDYFRDKGFKKTVTKKISLSLEEGYYLVTEAITDPNGISNSYSLQAEKGVLQIDISDAPLFIEKPTQ